MLAPILPHSRPSCIATLFCVLLSAPATAQERDRYGGIKSLTGEKTGFFHAQLIDGRWWLITPDGNAFFSKGVCHVSFEGDIARTSNDSPYRHAAQDKYKNVAAWANASAERLRTWGFNTAGAWSSPQLEQAGLAYCPILDLGARSTPDAWIKGLFPDVFDPAFAEAAAKHAADACTPRKDDPWLLGYFIDNEFHWGADRRSRDTLLDVFMKMPADSPGHRRALTFMTDRGNQSGRPLEGDRIAFIPLVADEYFRITCDAIRKSDPHHLILGCRFAGLVDDQVLVAMRDRVDVVSVHSYDRAPPEKTIRHMSQITRKPVMITEFSFKAQDSGLPNTRGGGVAVPTQADRADLFQNFAIAAAQLPMCVGYHWFEYTDEPKEGRFDGEACNYGIVKIDDTPWDTLTGRMTKINPTMEQLHLLDKSRVLQHRQPHRQPDDNENYKNLTGDPFQA